MLHLQWDVFRFLSIMGSSMKGYKYENTKANMRTAYLVQLYTTVYIY